MFTLDAINAASKPEHYEAIRRMAAALLEGERDLVANTANIASLLYHTLADVNWAGFYFLRGDELVLGPFCGKPACTRIALSRGVCGAAATRRETVVVADVHQFHGHIACDAESASEIVVPIVVAGRLVGVLDVDSQTPGRFDSVDQAGLEAIVAELIAGTDV
jgi:L-methionine (R)-S-oxide reductase